jgi:hypothetical protein
MCGRRWGGEERKERSRMRRRSNKKIMQEKVSN